MEQSGESGFYDVPEGCVVDILSLTTPLDAESDVVWEKFLPLDYQKIIESSINPSFPEFSSTKDLFLHLSYHPLIIDGGNKSFSLEKRSGKKCYMLAARNLTIAWGDTPEFWKCTSSPDSRFEEAAELIIVCWLDINGKISTSLLSPDTNYAAYLVYKLTDNTSGFNQLTDFPPEIFVGRIGEENEVQLAILEPENLNRRQFIRDTRVIYPKEREDGWLEIELGEFYNNKDEDAEVKMSLREVDSNVEKEGLIVQGIEIRPKEGQLEEGLNIEGVLALCAFLPFSAFELKTCHSMYSLRPKMIVQKISDLLLFKSEFKSWTFILRQRK